MSDISPNLSMPFIAPSQAQKHVTHNEAIGLLDILVQLAVESASETVPPGAPDIGARYIVGSGGTLSWAGHDGEIASYEETGWRFVAPVSGMLAYVLDQTRIMVREDADWAPLRANLTADDLENLPGLGINTTPDATNRLAVASAATLLNNDGGGHQLKINKNGSGDTASLLFQSGWTGHAEMGLAGSTDFSVKVSADGSAWHTAIQADAATGRVSFPGGGVRELLSGPRDWYVDPALGSDGTDGRAPGSGAFATIQRAVDAAVAVDGGGQALTIHLADGSYTLAAPIRVPHGLVGVERLIISGNSATPTNVVLNGSAGVLDCAAAKVTLTGVTMQTASGDCIFARDCAKVSLSDVAFQSAGAAHIRLVGAHCEVQGDYAILGDADAHIVLERGAMLSAENCAVTLSNTPAFATAFLRCIGNSHARIAGTTFAGSATGTRYDVSLNATVDTGGAGATYLPGDTAGTLSNGGIYA